MSPAPLHPLLAAARAQYQFLDWEELAAAGAAGRALAAAHPGPGELDAALRLAGRLLERGMVYKARGRVGWRVAARAPVLPARHLETLQRLGAVVDRLVTAAAAALPGSAWLRTRLGFPFRPEEEELLPAALRHPLSFLRLDLVPDAAGELRLIELQTVAGGLGITQALREVYGPHPALPGIAAGLDEALAVGYRAFCDGAGRAPAPRPVVGVFVNAASDYRHELFVFASALRRVEMVVGPWVRPGAAAFPCLGDGRAPDALFRFLDSGRVLAGASSFKRTLVRRVAAGELCMLNPWIDALDDKRLLAVVHDEDAEAALGGRLSAADWQTLRAAVPRTWRLDAERGASLKGRARAERAVYLKKGRSAMSRGLVDGQQENRGRFDAAVDAAVAEGDWVAQEAVRGGPWPFTVLDPDAGALRELQGYVRLTPVYGRAADGGVRLCDVCVTARPQRSRVHGASDACIVVPVAGG
ncbi:MAG TPA: hypothetical protein VGQ83_25515 [Polyangia bacterium]